MDSYEFGCDYPAFEEEGIVEFSARGDMEDSIGLNCWRYFSGSDDCDVLLFGDNTSHRAFHVPS